MAVADSRSGVGDDAVLAATGKRPDDWFRMLDERNATTWRHADIAAWLVRDHGVDPWWSQNLTVRYEQERGMRAPGQMADGTYSVSTSRTLAGDKRQVLEAAVAAVRESVGMEPASVNADAAYATARWKLDTGTLLLTVNPPKSGKSSVNLTHSKLRNPEAMSAAKDTLSAMLERVAATLG
ncbi:DUF4287 domain-containing protein [Lysobacter korlensis]|uniref:DUF4287 domain-containing protein n=1 Tax=Lysobacter korlensis TaxID=553636 RepID=A0ABV6RVM4_9GAMM